MQIKQFTDHIRVSFDEEEQLSPLAIKVLSRRGVEYAITPDIIRRNGAEQLLFDTQNTEPLRSGLFSMGAWEREQSVRRLIANFCALLEAVENDSFLEDTFILLQPEYVFTKTMSGEGQFVIIPLKEHQGWEYEMQWLEQCIRFLGDLLDGCEDETLRVMHKKVLDAGVDDGADRGTKRFRYRELLMDMIQMTKDASFREQIRERTGTTELELRYDGTYGKLAFFIRKDEFVIGKDALADGVITGNHAISRRHCVVRKRNDLWIVSDLGSTNDTYLDGKRVMEEEEALLRNGMKLTLADMSFDVTVTNA